MKGYDDTSHGAVTPAARRAPLTPSALRFQAWKQLMPVRRRPGEWARRALNIGVATVLVFLTAPLMLAIALLVRITSGGPVIYRQPRVGLDRRVDRGSASLDARRHRDLGGRIFTIYKFRTMRVDVEERRETWAAEDDPRITPVGRILRSFRLDELPQLFNVLKGDMNVVGPRPEQPSIFAGIRDEVSQYTRRQRVLPGITGLAQVTLSYDASLRDVRRKVDHDLRYIRRRSPSGDLVIMAKTVPVVVMRRGWR